MLAVVCCRCVARMRYAIDAGGWSVEGRPSLRGELARAGVGRRGGAQQARCGDWNSDRAFLHAGRAQISRPRPFSFSIFVVPASPLQTAPSPPIAPAMSVNIPINQSDPSAPTPQNTPLTHAPIAQGLSRPTVPDITEGDEEAEEAEPSGSIQQAMLGLVHGKLSGLVGKSSGYVENLPVEVKKNVEALKGVQVKQVELQNQYKRECLELEKKVRLGACYGMREDRADRAGHSLWGPCIRGRCGVGARLMARPPELCGLINHCPGFSRVRRLLDRVAAPVWGVDVGPVEPFC